MASVTALQAAASWFMTLGALGSAERALAASSSLVEETDMERRYFNMSLRLSGSWEDGRRGERERGREGGRREGGEEGGREGGREEGNTIQYPLYLHCSYHH